jgi:type I restriction enzyme S subunit
LDRYRKPITKSDRREGSYPYYGAMGVVDYVDGYLFDEPLILLGEDGAKWGSGETCAFKAAGKYWVNNHAHIMRPDRSQVLDDWLVYYLCGTDLLPFITGLTVPKLNQERMREIPIPVPRLEEQRRIVAVLDETFAAIATATANAEKNLANAREILLDAMDGELECSGPDWTETTMEAICSRFEYGTSAKSSPTGSVPVLRMGNLQNGEIDWSDLVFTDDQEDIAQLSLRPKDVLFNRTNSLEHVGKSAIVRSDIPAVFAGYLIRLHYRREAIDPEFLNLYLNSRGVRAHGRSLAGKSVNQANISAGKLKTYPINLPPLPEQSRIVSLIAGLRENLERLQAVQRAKIDKLAALKQSLLHRAFSGELTSKAAVALAPNDNFATPGFAAKVVAFAYERHVAKNRVRNFGTVKAEKILHMVEAIGGIDLGRQPLRQAAGPDDAKHRHATWDWARSQHFFRFNKRSGGGHDFEKLSSYSGMIEDARTAIAGTAVEKAIELLVDMDRDFAELIATTYSAWNNLIIDQCATTDDEIVLAARDNWHRDKLRFDPSRFHDAIRFIRNNSIVPDGTAKRAGGQEALIF